MKRKNSLSSLVLGQSLAGEAANGVASRERFSGFVTSEARRLLEKQTGKIFFFHREKVQKFGIGSDEMIGLYKMLTMSKMSVVTE